MTHYICIGLGACGAMLPTPGVCTTEECPRNGMPMSECDCTDGQHRMAIPPEAEKDETREQ